MISNNDFVLDEFLKHDEELMRLENEIKNQAQKFGFSNDQFLKKDLPMLEKKFGQVDSYDDNDDSEIPPMPMHMPKEVKSKIIRYDVGSNGVGQKQNNLITYDEFNKNKKKSKGKTVIPPQDFAPLKRLVTDNDENVNSNIEFLKQEVATKTTTYKDMKQSRYVNLPNAGVESDLNITVSK